MTSTRLSGVTESPSKQDRSTILDMQDEFLESLARLHATCSNKRSLGGKGRTLTRITKEQLTKKAKDTLVIASMFLEVAQTFRLDSVRLDEELTDALKRPQYYSVHALKELRMERDWALCQSETYMRSTKSYLKLHNRINRRLWWMLWLKK